MRTMTRVRVCLGDLAKHNVAQRIRDPHVARELFTLKAYVSEGPNELTLLVEEAGARKACEDTSKIEEHRSRPPLVDEDCVALRQKNVQRVTVPDSDNRCAE